MIADGHIESYGAIDPDNKKGFVNDRLRSMFFKIREKVEEIDPDFVVMEGTQYQKNAQSFNILSKLQGIIMAILFVKDIGSYIVAPTCWKSFCGIQGQRRHEQKANTQAFVQEKYGLTATEDEADAIGIATWAAANVSKFNEEKE
ncbi:MAG: hypothetical protein NC202_05260 [Roseburia sp.]|nr:hypothetical protein [Roseburia sp.]